MNSVDVFLHHPYSDHNSYFDQLFVRKSNEPALRKGKVNCNLFGTIRITFYKFVSVYFFTFYQQESQFTLLHILTRTSEIEILQVINDNSYQIHKIHSGELLIMVVHQSPSLAFPGSQCRK